MVAKTKAERRVQAKEVLAEIVEEAVKEQEEIGERVPGKVVRGIKTPWTRADVDKIFPIVSLIPEQTIRVTYNGVSYQLIQDLEMVVPSVIRDIYNNSRKRVRQGTQIPGVFVEGGAGGLPPEF